MFKDKEKQKEANRLAKARQRAKGVTQRGFIGMTNEGMTSEFSNCDVTPNLELCRTCGELLPPLESPRKYPGICLPCVMTKDHFLDCSCDGCARKKLLQSLEYKKVI